MTNPDTVAFHFKRPMLHMSRATAREIWLMHYEVEPDLTKDLHFGESKMEVRLDESVPFGDVRIQEAEAK